MLSKEFRVALSGIVARILLDSPIPLSRNELLDNITSGKKFSQSAQDQFLSSLRERKLIQIVREEGTSKYLADDKEMLERIALPRVSEDTEEVHMKGLNSKEQHARLVVATRALKRLAASATASRAQSRAELFIAPKSDKHQKRQIWDISWQTRFLKKLHELGYLEAGDDEGTTVYGANNTEQMQKLIDNKVEPCIATILWPETPCKLNHESKETEPAAPAPGPVGITPEESTPAPNETAVHPPESEAGLLHPPESKETPESEIQSIAEELSPSSLAKRESPQTVAYIHAAIDIIVELVKEDQKTTTVAMQAVTRTTELLGDIAKKVADLYVAVSGMKKEIEHLHSKADKLHEENVQIRSETGSASKVLNGLNEHFSPNEAVLNGIKKRMGDLEKLAQDHKDLLEANAKFVKSSMAEAASAMVDSAAKAFIQADHSIVLARIESMEDGVTTGLSQTSKSLEAINQALEMVKVEYRAHNKMPAIVDRMSSVMKELQILQALIPGINPSRG